MADEHLTTANTAQPREDTPAWGIGLLVGVVALIILGFWMNRTMTAFDPEAPGYLQWLRILGVIATLGILTILYKENPFFRFLEHIFIGLATGYGVLITWQQIILPRWISPMVPSSIMKASDPELVAAQGQWWLFFALLIGLLFFTVYIPRLAWMNRFAIGVLMGYSAGNALQQFIGGIGPQIVTSFKPPVTVYQVEGAKIDANNFIAGGVWWHPFSIVFIIVLLCVFAYFFFSIEHKKYPALSKPANVGRYFIMITLGAIFGTTVMGRFSLLIARMDYLLDSFTGWWHAIIR